MPTDRFRSSRSPCAVPVVQAGSLARSAVTRGPLAGSGVVLRTRALVFVVTLALASAEAASGQTLLVRASAQETGEPLQGALVSVGGPAGWRGNALTNAAGRAVFPALAPGSYDVRVELIGRETARRAGVQVAAEGNATVEAVLESRAIELEGLSVEGEERCSVRPDEGLRVAAVWDEARKALEAARFTDQQGVYQYRLRRVERTLDRDGTVLQQEVDRSTTYTRVPFESRPAEELMERGFIQDPDDGSPGTVYYGPDANVLLSDAFLDAHCMRLRTDESGRRVGLTFQPIRGRRIPDISGTLWIDPQTWELQDLEYVYVNVPLDMDLHDVGGTVAYRGLPDGTWIVRRWAIRMPRTGVSRTLDGGSRPYQAGLNVASGEVLRVRTPGGGVVLSSSSAALEGTVFASGASEPVEGARVSLLGTDQTAVTARDGRFRFSELPEGSYRVGFNHPLLDAFGVRTEPVGATLALGDVAAVVLRMPDEPALAAAACRTELATELKGTGLLVGRVLDGSGAPLEGAEVTVDWTDRGVRMQPGPPSLRSRAAGMAPPPRGGVSSRDPVMGVRLSEDQTSMTLRTDARGAYRACGVPELTTLDVRARWGPSEVRIESFRIGDAGQVAVLDLTLGVGAGNEGP